MCSISCQFATSLGEIMLKLYTDGATKGNPGPAGIGILVSGLPQQIQHHAALPAMSNQLDPGSAKSRCPSPGSTRFAPSWNRKLVSVILSFHGSIDVKKSLKLQQYWKFQAFWSKRTSLGYSWLFKHFELLLTIHVILGIRFAFDGTEWHLST